MEEVKITRYWKPLSGKVVLLIGSKDYTLSGLSEKKCLVLIGEPGIGKTTCVKQEEKNLRATGQKCLYIDLRSVGTDIGLKEKIYKDREIEEWIQGDYELELFLDSLDECRLRVGNIVDVLIDVLVRMPLDRLKLRLVCRTSEWSSYMQDRLRNLWRGHLGSEEDADEIVSVYEMLPLEENDIREFARYRGVDPDRFWSEAKKYGIEPFAQNPVTLQFLLSRFQERGSLTGITRKALFKDGCEQLCSEPSASRRASGPRGGLALQQRRMVAERIAALMMFCGYTAVSNKEVDVRDDILPISRIVGGEESEDQLQVEVNKEAVEKTLESPLFKSAGDPEHSCFVHQSYAEFLAAYYLFRHGVDWKRVKGLLVDPKSGRIFPQIRGVTAWLAALKRDFYKKIVELDPLLILAGDVASAGSKEETDKLCEQLTEKLLELASREEIPARYYWDLTQHLHRLKHGRLIEQVDEYIWRREGEEGGRLLALNIAGACGLKELAEKLVDLASNTNEPYRVRCYALRAVRRMDDDLALSNATKDKLKDKLVRFLSSSPDDDPDDELKGYAFSILWPDLISTDEVFEKLAPPNIEFFFGFYGLFLARLGKQLKPSDLPPALKWVEKQPREHEIPHAFRRLMEDIFVKAAENLDDTIIVPFAKAVFRRYVLFDYVIIDREKRELFRAAIFKEEKDKLRKELVSEIVKSVADTEKTYVFGAMARSSLHLVQPEDMMWLIKMVLSGDTEPIRQAWAELARWVYNGSPEHKKAVREAATESPELRDVFKELLEPDSPEARQARKLQKELEEISKRPPLPFTPQEEVSRLLDKFEGGDLDAWWHLNIAMRRETDGSEYGSEFSPDLSAMPGWQNSDGETRKRILDAAYKYVLEKEPDVGSWLLSNTFRRPEAAGYRALFIIAKKGDTDRVPAEVWGKWAPIIIWYSIFISSVTSDSTFVGSVGEEAGRLHSLLLCTAYKHAPDKVCDTLSRLIDKENEAGHILIVKAIEPCWDDRIARLILGKAKQSTMKPPCVGTLLKHLLQHGVTEAVQFCKSLIQRIRSSKKGDTMERALHAAEALLLENPEDGWSFVWEAVKSDTDFGKRLFEMVSWPLDVKGKTKRFLDTLSEEQLANLFIWLEQQFPHCDDPKHEGSYVVTTREQVAEFRDKVLAALRDRGTPQAVDAIERIRSKFPHLDWLKQVWLEAKEKMVENTWLPPRPADFLRLLLEKDKRFVQTGEHLLDVIIESLERLQQKLCGETPCAQFLWNTGKTYHPKTEPEISDFIKVHLKDDLEERRIIVNREVQIRRLSTRGIGESTDIHVDAVAEDGDIVTVVIEVKGCWNKNLFEDIRNQLRERYLKGVTKYGLYLVCWFAAEKWDPEDDRKRRCDGWTKKELMSRLQEKADQLSGSDLRIKVYVLDCSLPSRED